MERDADGGGPAFPQSDLSGYGMGPCATQNQGMSLRDWFAGQALSGICASHGTYGLGNGVGDNAARAYEQADAMLAARKHSN